jgi:hypothetical protein
VQAIASRLRQFRFVAASAGRRAKKILDAYLRELKASKRARKEWRGIKYTFDVFFIFKIFSYYKNMKLNRL